MHLDAILCYKSPHSGPIWIWGSKYLDWALDAGRKLHRQGMLSCGAFRHPSSRRATVLLFHAGMNDEKVCNVDRSTERI